jgi:hypothetical protein
MAVVQQQLTDLLDQALPARFAEPGRGEPSGAVQERVRRELATNCSSDLADLLLFAHDVGRFCDERGIPLRRAARPPRAWWCGRSASASRRPKATGTFQEHSRCL